MKQILVTQALIKKGQQVLMLQRATSRDGLTLELPGGAVDFGESPKKALARNVARQLGHKPQALQLTDVVSESDTDTQTIAVVFSTSLEGQNERLSLSDEYKRYGWYSLSDIQPLQVDSITRQTLGIQTATDRTEKIDETKEVIITTPPKEVIVYTDGGSRGNPGPSAAGFVILSADEQVLFEGGKYLGITTNNQAEYQAVKLGLEKAAEIGARSVKFRMDSLLIVNQMLGVYQIKNRDLWPIYANIKELIKKFDKVSFMHVRREFNKDADALVNKVLDERS